MSAPRENNQLCILPPKTEKKGKALEEEVQAELRRWFGHAVENWQLVGERVIEYALPTQAQVRHDIAPEELQLSERLFVCGDHLLNGSINGTMRSGRLAAQAIGAALA